jgi:macrolide transport system ATP-binding/permease protein
VKKLLRRIHFWLNHRRAAAELAEEMESHRLMRQAQLQQSGLAEQEASFASKRAMGNAVLAAEQAREIWTWRWLDDAWRDLLIGLRGFRKSPGFWLGASLILSLGIGINVAVFQIIDVWFWRPPQIQDPASMVRLYKLGRGDFSYPAAQMFNPTNSVFSSFFIRAGFPSNLLVWGDNPANRVWASFVSSNWFEELGVRPKYGRVFNAADDAGGAPPTVVISQVVWERLLDSDPETVGKSVRVNNRSAVVIGVVPFDVIGRDLVWMPITHFEYFVPGTDFKTSWDRKDVQIYARLKNGVPLNSVRDALQPLMNELHRLDPQSFNERAFFLPSPASARFENPFGGPSVQLNLGMPPGAYLILALLILLIASANLMNLVLSRAMNRVRDFSIRVSLGAGRWRIMRQLMAENALLAFFGSIVGLVLAYWWTRVFVATLPLLIVGQQFNFNWHTIAATVVAGSIAAGAIGLLPAWKISRSSLTISIKDGGHQISAGLHRTRWRHLLLAAQIGCSCLLLVLTGLILRSLQRGMPNTGFNPDNVAILTVPLAGEGLKAEAASSYWSRLRETMESDPGAESVSLVSQAPSECCRTFYSEMMGPVSYYEVGPRFFDVMKIPIRVGRDFNAADPFGSTAIISERLARKLYGSTNVIGRAFPTDALSDSFELQDVAKSNPSATIIGVAADAGFVQRNSEGIGELYFPLDRATSNRALLVRARSNPARFVNLSRTAALSLNANLLPDTRLLAEDFASRRAPLRVIGAVLAVLGTLALSITCIGIFGTVSYAATLRRQEIGIRMALGAERSAMFLLLLKQLRWPLSVGMAFGLAAAIPTGQIFLANPFLLVKPFDPPILTIVAGFVFLTAIVAAFLPSWRAVRQDPMDSLRSE